jgi:antitoxin ParD1/3/4
MPNAIRRDVRLDPDQDAFIEAQLENGSYRSASDVIGAGLEALRDQEAEIETWLREEVAPVYDAMKANPELGIPAKTVFDAIRARHAASVKIVE